jgi:hypothetical protein
MRDAWNMHGQFGKPTRYPLHKDDLMKPDWISEVILVGSGLVLFLPILAILIELLMGAFGQH